MEQNVLEEKKELIQQLLQDRTYRPMKFKELAGLLQVPKEERDELRQVLEKLMEEGTVELDQAGRYRAANADIKTGVFQGTLRGFGFVLLEGEPDVFISEDDVHGARDKDKVMISVKEEFRGRSAVQKKREGCVLKILERGNDTVVGTFRINGNNGYVTPDNQKFGSEIYIAREHTKGAVNGHKVVVAIRDYGSESKLPQGRVIEILGHIDDPGVDIMSVIRGNGLPVEFPPEVLRMTEQLPSEAEEEAMLGRLDLRDILTVTIDGEDAKDLDDAVTIESIENGYRLGVHIADVSHYVRENSALDREAQKRGTSVYLVDRVIPMLPHILSNGICSLNAETDRLALSCIMEIDLSGTVLSHRIAESVIRVDRRMSYNKVFELLNCPEEQHPEGDGEASVRYTYKEQDHAEELAQYGSKYIEMFQKMLLLSDILRDKRRKRGSLDFDLPETKIELDEEGHPLFISPYERNRAHMIIEDFMLVANETVAEEYFWMELPFLYRTHENPDEERIQKLNVFINNFGYSVHFANDEIHPKELQKLLTRIEGTPEETLISRLALRSMKQAKYTTTCDGHFGLAAKYYCHFTSPIRRYPDLQIHRIIKENLHGQLGEKRIAHYNSILPEVAGQSSRMERRAEEAERETEKLKKAEYMLQFVGEQFTGVISGVSSWGIYVELQNTVEGMIRMSELADDYYIFDEAHYRMVGEHNGKEYKLGQKLEILVVRVDPLIHTVDFLPAEYKPREKA